MIVGVGTPLRSAAPAVVFRQAKEQLGWVVEHGPRDRPMYLTGRGGWAFNAAKAIRFARKLDAEDFIREWLSDPQGLRVTDLAQSTTLGERP